MTTDSKIEWTTHTFNPWWGCVKVSPGCNHCYAETFSKRVGQNNIWGAKADRRFFGDAHWNEPRKWNRAAEASGKRTFVFCASMADVFEDRRDLVPHRLRLFELIEDTPHLTWQLLTKRPENVRRLSLPWRALGWPKNVWLGTSVEDQRRADERIGKLLQDSGASVNFLSVEPLIGPVDLRCVGAAQLAGGRFGVNYLDQEYMSVDWVIVGGESGPRARPVDPDWVRSLRDQCVAESVPFFFKQWGGRTPKAGGRELDGRTWEQMP